MAAFRPHFIGRTVALLLAAVSGCGDSDGEPSGPAGEEVVSVSITPDSALLLVGEVVQLVATPQSETGSFLDRPVEWTSSAQEVATVSSQGTISAVSNGEALISATIDGVSGSAVARVAPQVDSVLVEPDTLRILRGETTELAVAVFDGWGRVSAEPAKWLSTDSDVVTVDDGGRVVAVETGQAVVYASALDITDSTTVLVITQPNRVDIGPDSLHLARGDSVQLAAAVLDEAGHPITATVEWSSDDPIIASVRSDGTVVSHVPGVVEVSASAANVYGSTVVVVGLDDFMRSYIEAIFLGSGPLVPRDGLRACVGTGRWDAFPRGSVVRVIASNTLDFGLDGVDTKLLLQEALASIETATLGQIQTTFETTDEIDPVPGDLEATATDHPDPVGEGCTFNRGCVFVSHSTFGTMSASRTVLMEDILPSDAYVHDVVGHGIMGMCHIDSKLIGGNDRSLMAGGPGAVSGLIPDALSPLDIAAARAVYQSSLDPGATREEFVHAGLVNP